MNPPLVHRIDQHDFLDVADRLAAVYVECFGSEPWNEVFRPEDVIGRVQEVLDFKDSILLVAEDDKDIFGATLHYPLHYNKDVSAAVAPDLAGAMYCEELFVAVTCQRRGIGGRLLDTAAGISMALGYDRRVLRTASDYEQAKRFYMSRGYRIVGRMQCRSRKRAEGSEQTITETRIVMLQDSRSARRST